MSLGSRKARSATSRGRHCRGHVVVKCAGRVLEYRAARNQRCPAGRDGALLMSASEMTLRGFAVNPGKENLHADSRPESGHVPTVAPQSTSLNGASKGAAALLRPWVGKSEAVLAHLRGHVRALRLPARAANASKALRTSVLRQIWPRVRSFVCVKIPASMSGVIGA